MSFHFVSSNVEKITTFKLTFEVLLFYRQTHDRLVQYRRIYYRAYLCYQCSPLTSVTASIQASHVSQSGVNTVEGTAYLEGTRVLKRS